MPLVADLEAWMRTERAKPVVRTVEVKGQRESAGMAALQSLAEEIWRLIARALPAGV